MSSSRLWDERIRCRHTQARNVAGQRAMSLQGAAQHARGKLQ